MIHPYTIVVSIHPPATVEDFFIMHKDVRTFHGRVHEKQMYDYAWWMEGLKKNPEKYYRLTREFYYEFTDFVDAVAFDKKWAGHANQTRLSAPPVKPPRSRHEIGKLPHAYKWGNNPACKESEYNCHECGLQVFGEDVRFIAYGRTCANGEHSPCPACGEENYVHRAVNEEE